MIKNMSSERFKSLVLLFLIIFLFSDKYSQEESVITVSKDTIKTVALEMMKSSKYCALITLDSDGRPQVRTMNPYPQEDDLVIWFATHRNSRKTKEMLNDSRVCVYYADHKTPTGYVAITGKVEIIDNKETVIKKKRKYWEGSIPDWENNLVLIKIVPEKIDIVNYAHGLNGNSETWRSPSADLTKE